MNEWMSEWNLVDKSMHPAIILVLFLKHETENQRNAEKKFN